MSVTRLAPATRWQVPAEGVEHTWVYRGQVVPRDTRMAVQAEIARIDDAAHTVHADGFLLVDGRAIYRMKGFALRQLA